MCRAGRPNAKGMEELLEEWLAVEDVSDNEFIDMLTSYALPAWDHRTHLRIAWLHLTTHGRREGMKLIFTRIKDFIDHSDRTGGKTFHETMVRLVCIATKNTVPNDDLWVLLLLRLISGYTWCTMQSKPP